MSVLDLLQLGILKLNYIVCHLRINTRYLPRHAATLASNIACYVLVWAIVGNEMTTYGKQNILKIVNEAYCS